MMKLFIHLVLFFSISFTAIASIELVPVPTPDFNYQVQTYTNISSDIENFISGVDKIFIDRDLNPILLPAGFTATKTSLSTVNRIYSGELGNTVVFIKAGVIPTQISKNLDTLKFDNGFLHHLELANGLGVAIFVQTENWENAAEIFTNIRSKYSINKNTTEQSILQKSLWALSPISSAIAADIVDCDPKLKSSPDNLDKLIVAGDAMANQASLIQHVSGCALSAVKGVWAGSGGAVIGVTKGVVDFLQSPIESGKKYWQSTTQLWNVTKQFFSDFENEARKLYSTFDSLDPLVKTKLACQVIGTIGGGVLLSYLTAGALSSTAMANVLLKIKIALQEALTLAKFSGVKKTLAVTETAIAKVEKIEIDLHKDLFKISRGTPEVSLVKNNEVLEGLKNMPLKADYGKRKGGLNDSELQQLFRSVSDHPVASLSKVAKYEKNSPGMGYCFGRATTAHIKALMNGADKDSIRKMWAFGDLKTGDTNWRYHVTTMVRDSKGEWQAIDPIMGKVMPAAQWYKEMKKFDSTGNMRIVDTEAKRFGPSGGKYSPAEFNRGSYENYFTDLMKAFKAETSAIVANRKLAH